MNDIPVTIKILMKEIETLTTPPNSIMVISILLILVLLMFVLFGLSRKKAKFNQELITFQNKLVAAINTEKNLEINMNEILGKYADLISAAGYYFYSYKSKEDCYVLSNTRVSGESSDISPSYSGLLPYKKEQFKAPQRFDTSKIPDALNVFKEGDVSLLAIPIGNQKCFICIGPLSRYFKINKKIRKILGTSTKSIEPLLNLVTENMELKERINITETKAKAVENIQHSFANYTDMINAITNISIETSGAEGGLLIAVDEDGQFTSPVSFMLEAERLEAITAEMMLSDSLFDLIQDKNHIIIRKGDKNYDIIPNSFKALDIGIFFLLNISYKQFEGYMCIWYKEDQHLEDYKITAVQMMATKIGEVMENSIVFKDISNSYISILKIIAQTLDNLSPNTVGRSDMMYRYAYIIANAINLPQSDIQDIALAAYLSNIGVVGLSGGLFRKSDKYSEAEFELMKMHCEAGASIVEATINNPKIARYILEHHERMDGLGYPERLSGSQISEGGRIIAVVQFFTAKLIGREGRDPVEFNVALQQIKSAAGTQLDAHYVDILFNWINEKRERSELKGKTLGPCWEMRCSPKEICLTCPIFGTRDKNCFEMPVNSCAAHGNRCESCFVRTELANRVRYD